MKFSEAKFKALENLIAHSSPNAKGVPMWCNVNKIAKANTILSLHTAECLMVNSKNPLLVRITEAGKRVHQGFAKMKREAELAIIREQQRMEQQNG